MMFCNNIIFILIKKIIGLVGNLSSKKLMFSAHCWHKTHENSPKLLSYITSVVVDGEGSLCKFRFAEPLMCFICLIHFLCKSFMCRLWEHAAVTLIDMFNILKNSNTIWVADENILIAYLPCFIQKCNNPSRFLQVD